VLSCCGKTAGQELYGWRGLCDRKRLFSQQPKNSYHMNIHEQFDQAVTRSKTLSERPGNDVLLQLYALYKQATEGDVNIEAPANAFDFVAKAKFNAWESLKGKSKESAMQEYVELIGKLK
jgi:diazepam-binding inhibitor (GABA receptor modulating acyl-CoA-binding protein)